MAIPLLTNTVDLESGEELILEIAAPTIAAKEPHKRTLKDVVRADDRKKAVKAAKK